MVLWDLVTEVFNKYRDDYIDERKKKPWKENLFFVPIILAVVVFIIILIKIVST